MKTFIFVYSRIVLAIAVVSIIVSILFPDFVNPIITFLFIFVEFILYYRYTGTTKFSINRQKKISLALSILGIAVFAIGFITLMIAGGLPATNSSESEYYVVNHGAIVKEITYGTYRLLHLCRVALADGLPLAFSALFCNVISRKDG